MNPMILADSILEGSSITATGISDSSQYFLVDGRPYTWLQFPSTGTKYIVIDCGTPKSADTLGIIGHNLNTATASLGLGSSDDGVTWTTRLVAQHPSDDHAVLRTFTAATARYWRIVVSGGAMTTPPMLAVAMLGGRIDFPYPPDTPFTPWSETIESDTNDSKAGNPLGVVVRYFPVTIKPVFSNLTRSWVEGTYLPFRQNYSRWGRYFFWAWDLGTYPQQVHYVKDSAQYAPDVAVLSYYNKLSLEFKGVMER